ncbi:MAG: RNA polymerase sigma factor [Acidimicrobiales bacterium]
MRAEGSDLAAFVSGSYAKAYRTACLIVRNPADAEEAVQEAFLRAWRFRASVKEGRPLEPWLYRVLMNACYSKLRSTARQRTDEELPDDVVAAGGDPFDRAGDAELGAVVRSALAALPEPLRAPVVLRYFAGLSEKEIAVAIGRLVSPPLRSDSLAASRRPGTVKSRLHEARRLLAGDERLAQFAAEVAQ